MLLEETQKTAQAVTGPEVAFDAIVPAVFGFGFLCLYYSYERVSPRTMPEACSTAISLAASSRRQYVGRGMSLDDSLLYRLGFDRAVLVT